MCRALMKTAFCPLGCWGEISVDTALCHKNTKQPHSGLTQEESLLVSSGRTLQRQLWQTVLLGPPEDRVLTGPIWRVGKVRGCIPENCAGCLP